MKSIIPSICSSVVQKLNHYYPSFFALWLCLPIQDSMGKGQVIDSKSKLPRVLHQLSVPKVLRYYRKGLMVHLSLQAKGFKPD
jgi:hypothetical protein